jgi:hypothetical protein
MDPHGTPAFPNFMYIAILTAKGRSIVKVANGKGSWHLDNLQIGTAPPLKTP